MCFLWLTGVNKAFMNQNIYSFIEVLDSVRGYWYLWCMLSHCSTQSSNIGALCVYKHWEQYGSYRLSIQV